MCTEHILVSVLEVQYGWQCQSRLKQHSGREKRREDFFKEVRSEFQPAEWVRTPRARWRWHYLRVKALTHWFLGALSGCSTCVRPALNLKLPDWPCGYVGEALKGVHSLHIWLGDLFIPFVMGLFDQVHKSLITILSAHSWGTVWYRKHMDNAY